MLGWAKHQVTANQFFFYDASSMGANDYMNLAMEFLKNNE